MTGKILLFIIRYIILGYSGPFFRESTPEGEVLSFYTLWMHIYMQHKQNQVSRHYFMMYYVPKLAQFYCILQYFRGPVCTFSNIRTHF